MKPDGGPAKKEVGLDIETVDGQIVTISADDYARLQEYQWRIGTNGYVYKVGGRIRGVPCLMHRIVMNAGPGQEVHHGPLGKLNNMRSNLELTTPSEHQEHHKHLVIARNILGRKYDDWGVCHNCGKPYEKDPDHRGRQTCCSKRCATLLWAKKGSELHAEKAKSKRIADAMLKERLL
jgi:hypothetical protein